MVCTLNRLSILTITCLGAAEERRPVPDYFPPAPPSSGPLLVIGLLEKGLVSLESGSLLYRSGVKPATRRIFSAASAASAANGDSAVAAATGILLQGLKQATLGLCLLIDAVESGHGHAAAGRGIRLIRFNRHFALHSFMRWIRPYPRRTRWSWNPGSAGHWPSSSSCGRRGGRRRRAWSCHRS